MSAPDNDALLAVALTLAQAVGYTHVTREAIAAHADVSPALISVRFGTMKALRRALMRYAVRVQCVPIIAHGLAIKDPHAMRAPPSLQQAAARYITGSV